MEDASEQPHGHYIVFLAPTEDGSQCGFHRPLGGRDICSGESVARAPNSLWTPANMHVMEGVPDPRTLFVGACDEHVEELRKAVAQRGGEVEDLG